jgi:single-strand DNA-binding protein
MFFNRLEVMGFTGADAQVKYSANGTPYAILSVATKDSWRDANSDWQERTEWIRCVCCPCRHYIN